MDPKHCSWAVEQHCAHWPAGILHIERFAAKAPTAEEAAEALDQFEVVCQRSGVSFEITPDQSILEVLEEAGIPILGSCYEGVCGTCEARVLEGTPDQRDSVLTDAEKAAGEVMYDLRVALSHREAGAGPVKTVKTNYPKKCWYVAATCDEITESPLGRRLLGKDVVLWRGASGRRHRIRKPLRAPGISAVAQHHRRRSTGLRLPRMHLRPRRQVRLHSVSAASPDWDEGAGVSRPRASHLSSGSGWDRRPLRQVANRHALRGSTTRRGQHLPVPGR